MVKDTTCKERNLIQSVILQAMCENWYVGANIKRKTKNGRDIKLKQELSEDNDAGRAATIIK